MVPHAGVKDGTISQKAAHGAVTRTARVRRQQDSNLHSESGAAVGVFPRPTLRIFHPRDIYSGMSRDATDTHTLVLSVTEARRSPKPKARVRLSENQQCEPRQPGVAVKVATLAEVQVRQHDG